MITGTGHVWSKERGLRMLKPEVTLAQYQTKYPSAIAVRVPGMSSLNRWVNDGICPTPDGCRVEPDGTCEHECPSWLLILGYI